MEAAWYRACLERMADFVCAIDHDGVLVYANPAATTWLGMDPEELVGRSCLELVHPDDLERAAATISYGRGSKRAEVPVAFRLRRRDGWGTFEVRGHGLGTDPQGETMLIVARESNGAELLDDLLDKLAAGSDLPHALELIAQLLCRELWENTTGIVYHDAHGARHVVHTGMSEAMVALLESDLDTPWRRAMRRGEDQFVDHLDSLHPDLAAAMRASGFGSVISVPVADPLTGDPVCIVVAGPTWLAPELGLGVAIERVKRLLRVALYQRFHREMLERSARTDPLTGLANRRQFFDVLGLALNDLLVDPQRRVAVIYVDLDGFKEVNDRYGHGAGDQVLREVAERMRAVVPPPGATARLGGDEFAALVMAADADEVAQAIEATVQAPIRLREGSIKVTASTGTTRALPGDAPSAVVDRADALAYDAKRLRRQQAGR